MAKFSSETARNFCLINSRVSSSQTESLKVVIRLLGGREEGSITGVVGVEGALGALEVVDCCCCWGVAGGRDRKNACGNVALVVPRVDMFSQLTVLVGR